MDRYLMYLRKSRKDRDMEQATGQHDTLERHRRALLDLAQRQKLTIAEIYEEVVSGDTIADRPQMQQLLAAVETGLYAGVLVMEVPRLARGNTRDQGVVAETFQVTGTKIITPDKIYDPADEADEEYFEFGLFMSRREYKAINRRLQRGRLASLHEGKYIAGSPPYGYEKVKLPGQKGYTLSILPQEAGVVRDIFRLYLEGDPQPDGSCQLMGSFRIALLLNARQILSPSGGRWGASTVRDLLKNPVYAGFIRWSYRPVVKQMAGGEAVVSTPVNPNAAILPGLHPPIISQADWDAAQRILKSRGHPPVAGRTQVANPLAGLLFCAVCGRTLVQLPQKGRAPILACPTPRCPTVGSRTDVVEAAVWEGLREFFSHYRLEENLGNAGSGRSLLQSTREKAEKQKAALAALQLQRGRLYDFLERGVYNEAVFQERFGILNAQIAEAEAGLAASQEALLAQTEAFSQEAPALPSMQDLLDSFPQWESAAQKNAFLRQAAGRIVYSKTTGGRWTPSNLQLYFFPRLGGVSPSS